MDYNINKKLLNNKIETLNLKNPGDIYEYSHKKNVYTIEDFIDKQHKFSKKYGNIIKSKLVFDIDLTDPDSFS